MQERVLVTLHFNNKDIFSGEFGAFDVVHDALAKLLPVGSMTRQRVQIKTADDTLIYPDMFIGEINNHYGNCELYIATSPLAITDRPFKQVGFDHLALSVADRPKARDFFHKGLQMMIVRDDEHITVLTTGNTALFLFNAEPGKPLSDGVPSRIHHIGFVVDDLEAAYSHLQANFPDILSDFTVLERMERLSLYGRYQLGDITFMIQLSEIKAAYRGFEDPHSYSDIMYDYRSRPYGIRFERDS